MNKQRVLIISPDSKHFVREHIENALLEPKYEVTFFTITKNPLDEEFYHSHSVVTRSVKKDNRSLYVNGGQVLNSWLWLLKNMNSFDVIHIHFVDVRFLAFCKCILRSKAKIVMTYWGSDLLRSSERERTKMIPWIEKAYKINFNDLNSKNYFVSKFTSKYNEKLYVIDFGNSLIEIIDEEERKIGKAEAKRKFGFPLDKLVVHIGYNGSDAQQHVEILKSFVGLSDNIKDRLYIVIPFAYGIGGDNYTAEEYTNIVSEYASKTGIQYLISKDYLHTAELADFRLTADIFVYGQTTDAMSATIVETVYAGGEFIKPAWLDYSELENVGVNLYEYKEFSEIPGIIEKLLNNHVGMASNHEKNKEAIKSIKSWEILAPQWRSMYE